MHGLQPAPSYEVCPAGQLLETVGKAFYGENWKNRLADDLNIRERAFQRWLPGHAPIPAPIWEKLLVLIEQRTHALGAVRVLIEEELKR